MSEESVFGSKIKGLYKKICQEEWNAYIAGMLVAFFSILIMAWMRPWGIVGALRNWGDWILYAVGWLKEAPRSGWVDSGSVIGIGFAGGAFLSACLGSNFALRIPPVLEMVKGAVAGIFMGIGAAFAGGCNVGGMYNAIGDLAANGFSMWLGLIIGALIGLKYLYWEMEHVSWGSGGAKTIEFPAALQAILGIVALGALVWGAHTYSIQEGAIAKMSGILLISAALGYTMQRGRWCMAQAFREPHMTGDSTLARSVALSIALLAIGITILKATGLRPSYQYVRGTFGWGGVLGGTIFGFGMLLAGGCGSGTLWRVGEGQIKLWITVPFFGVSNALMVPWTKNLEKWGDWVDYVSEQLDSGDKLHAFGTHLGSFVYMPDTFLGYGGTLALILAVMAVWYVIVDWNEETNKLTLEM
jgi:uncharacterized membrane protein YedE/YeeE